MLRYIRSFAVLVMAVIGLSSAHAANEPGLQQALAEWITVSTKNQVPADTAAKYVREAYVAADKWDVDPLLILSYMKAESNYRSTAANKSGARGLMQIIPRWHHDKIAGRNIMHYKTNIDVGAQILNEYLKLHRENFTKAMRMYSGGAGSPYKGKIHKTYQELRDVAYGWKFTNDKQLIAEHRFVDPRRYQKTIQAYEKTQIKPPAPPSTIKTAELQQDLIYAAYERALSR